MYFSVICRTLHSFMVKNKLSLDVMKLLINYWFQKDSFISETNVINLDSPNKILLGRLKKQLKVRELLILDFMLLVLLHKEEKLVMQL